MFNTMPPLIELTATGVSETQLIMQRKLNEQYSGWSSEQLHDRLWELLKNGLHQQNANEVAMGLFFGFHFRLFPGNLIYLNLLHALLLEDWHFEHENIIYILRKIDNPSNTYAVFLLLCQLNGFTNINTPEYENLVKAATEFLADFGDGEAAEKLAHLSKYANPVVCEAAKKSLEQIKTR